MKSAKSHTMSRLALWWIDVHPRARRSWPRRRRRLRRSKRSSGVTHGQRPQEGRSPWPHHSTPSGTSATSSSPTARKPADYDPAAFQGIHARYVLVIIDEAGGVPKSIFDAVDALATNIDARVVAVGDPDDAASHFATICKPGSGWHVETISAFDTPAYTGEKVPEELLPLLVSPEWVEERKLRWGINSPIYAGGSRSNRKTTCASAACRHRTELMPWRSASLAAQTPRQSTSKATLAKALPGT
jgi:hypothetical protein